MGLFVRSVQLRLLPDDKILSLTHLLVSVREEEDGKTRSIGGFPCGLSSYSIKARFVSFCHARS